MFQRYNYTTQLYNVNLSNLVPNNLVNQFQIDQLKKATTDSIVKTESCMDLSVENSSRTSFQPVNYIDLPCNQSQFRNIATICNCLHQFTYNQTKCNDTTLDNNVISECKGTDKKPVSFTASLIIIIVGVLFTVSCLIFLLLCIRKRNQRKRLHQQSSTDMTPPSAAPPHESDSTNDNLQTSNHKNSHTASMSPISEERCSKTVKTVLHTSPPRSPPTPPTPAYSNVDYNRDYSLEKTLPVIFSPRTLSLDSTTSRVKLKQCQNSKKANSPPIIQTKASYSMSPKSPQFFVSPPLKSFTITASKSPEGVGNTTQKSMQNVC